MNSGHRFHVPTLHAFIQAVFHQMGSNDQEARGAKEVMWSFVTLMIITALYALNYNRIHKNPYPLDAPVNNN